MGKVQFALFAIDGHCVEPTEAANETFGPSTAAAVLAYKTQRSIINRAYQSKPDDILGKMTIAALDHDMLAKQGQPSPGQTCRCGNDVQARAHRTARFQQSAPSAAAFAVNYAELQRTELAELPLAEQYRARGTKQRLYGSFEYAADSWDKARRVIARLAHGPQGANPRFVVTSLRGDARHLYDKRYCGSGEAENRIKEAQFDLLGRRASCHRFWANQLRLLLAALAYTLMINLRRQALAGTELAKACTATIQVQLLKIAAAIVRNARWVRVLLASNHPMRDVFASAAHALAP